jgi:hypothetical protein
VSHPAHVVSRGVAAKRGHGGVVGGDEIADDDSHGSSGKEFSGRILVGGGNFQEITCAEFVATAIGLRGRVALRNRACGHQRPAARRCISQ